MTSTQVLIGLFWLPGLIGVGFLVIKYGSKLIDWIMRRIKFEWDWWRFKL